MIENFESKFLAFCKSKPKDEKYNGGDGKACALGQFVAGEGYVGWFLSMYSVGGADLYNGEETFDYPHSCWGAATMGAATFGALVQRLEEAGVK